jgi:ankyrin repeat and IBR domain-containing protein 1
LNSEEIIDKTVIYSNGTFKKIKYLLIDKALREVLSARSILKASYVYGFYLNSSDHKKFIFEFIQTELEEATENISQFIARPQKASKNKIIK